jgi:hypothetical protein
MLPLQVVGLGGSLSMLLLLHHTGEVPVRECHGRRQIVTTRMMAVLVLLLWELLVAVKAVVLWS